jgi:hypothetical protein
VYAFYHDVDGFVVNPTVQKRKCVKKRKSGAGSDGTVGGVTVPPKRGKNAPKRTKKRLSTRTHTLAPEY